MGASKEAESSKSNADIDLKSKMRSALVKKQKVQNSSKLIIPKSGSKVGASQTIKVASKMHRRKLGSS